MDQMTKRPMPTEEGILAFHRRCEDFYPADAVDASIEQQRKWYDALCAEFDAPSPAGLTRMDELVDGRIPTRRYRPAKVSSETRIYYIHGGGFVVGSLDIVFADYGVSVPSAPIVVSAEDQGVVEFQLFFAQG